MIRESELLHGKTIILGVIDLADPPVEAADQVATRIRAGLTHVSPDRLIPVRLRDEVSAARHRVRQAPGPQPGRGPGGPKSSPDGYLTP